MAFEDALVSRPVSVVVPVVSSIAGAIRQFVTGVIPAGYLMDYHISTELPQRRVMRRRFRPMSPSQIAVRKLPMLSINVETTSDSSDYSSGVTYWTSGRFMRDPTKLSRLFSDDENLRFAGFERERIVVRFGVSFMVESELKGVELMMYLRRTLPVNWKVYLNDIDIATEIPADILRLVWADMKLGDGSNPADVATFREYLRRITAGNIEQVVSSSTSRLVFAYSYRTNLLVSITSGPSLSLNREGSVVKNAQVDIPFEVDLSVPVAYGYKQENRLDGSPPTEDLGKIFAGPEGAGAYFSSVLKTRPPQMVSGLSMVFFASVITSDVDTSVPFGPDVTDLSGVVDPQVRKLIDELLKRTGGSSLVTAKVWIGGDEIPSGWTLSYDDWKLSIGRSVLQPRQKYHIGVYADISDATELVPSIRNPQAESPMIPIPG